MQGHHQGSLEAPSSRLAVHTRHKILSRLSALTRVQCCRCPCHAPPAPMMLACLRPRRTALCCQQHRNKSSALDTRHKKRMYLVHRTPQLNRINTSRAGSRASDEAKNSAQVGVPGQSSHLLEGCKSFVRRINVVLIHFICHQNNAFLRAEPDDIFLVLYTQHAAAGVPRVDDHQRPNTTPLTLGLRRSSTPRDQVLCCTDRSYIGCSRFVQPLLNISWKATARLH